MQIGNGKQGVRIGEYTDGITSEDKNAVLGWIEPACDNPQWILWFTKQGDAQLYTQRESTGGVIGYPIRISSKGIQDSVISGRMAAMDPDEDFRLNRLVHECLPGKVTLVLNRLFKTGEPYLGNLSLADDKIHAAFDHVCKILDFNVEGKNIFKRWLIDKDLYFWIIPGKNKIDSVVYVDPRRIKKIIECTKFINDSGQEQETESKSYYIYNEKGDPSNFVGIKLSIDSICHVPLKLFDGNFSNSQFFLFQFRKLFDDLLKIQLISSGVIQLEYWEEFRKCIEYISVICNVIP